MARKAAAAKVIEPTPDWEDIAESRGREVTRLSTEVSRTSMERLRWERDVYATARRQAWDDVTRNVGLYVKGQVMHELDDLLWRLRNMNTAKPTKSELDYVRVAASLVEEWRSGLDVAPAGGYVAELMRLRAALFVQGRVLHDRYGGISTGERCGCPGCELIREVHNDGKEKGAVGVDELSNDS